MTLSTSKDNPLPMSVSGAALAVFLCLSLGSFFVYGMLRDQEVGNVRRATSEETNRLKQVLSTRMEGRVKAVVRMAQRWEAAHGTPHDQWVRDVDNLILAAPGVRAIEWVDSTYHVRWIEPMEGNEKVIGLDVRFNEPRAHVFGKASVNTSSSLTPPIDLLQGYKAFLVYAPITIDQHFAGFMGCLLDVQQYFNSLIDAQTRNRYAISISQDGSEFYSASTDDTFREELAAQATVSVMDNTWTIRLMPGQRLVDSYASSMPAVVLACGLSAALLAACAVYWGLLSRRRMQAVRESEAIYRMMVEGVKDCAIFMLTPEGNIKTWNRAAEKIQGYTADEVTGRHFSLFYTSEDIIRNLPASVLRIAQAHGVYESEGLHVRKDGSTFWASILVAPLYGSGRKLVGFAKVTRDISERRKLEQHTADLVREEQRQLMEIVSIQREVAYSHHNLQHAMDLISERTCAITGAEAAVIEMLEGDDMVYRAASGKAKTYLNFRLKRSESLSGLCVTQNTLLQCDDSEVDSRVDKEACAKVGARSMVVVPLVREKEAVGVLKVYSSKQAAFSKKQVAALQLLAGVLSAALSDALVNDRLRQSEETFRTAMEYATIGMALVSPQGRWLKVNRALCDMLGYSEDELLALDFHEVTHPQDHARDTNAIQQLLNREIDSHQSEKRYVHKDGQVVYALLSVSLVWDAQGKPQNFIVQVQRLADHAEEKRPADRAGAQR